MHSSASSYLAYICVRSPLLVSTALDRPWYMADSLGADRFLKNSLLSAELRRLLLPTLHAVADDFDDALRCLMVLKSISEEYQIDEGSLNKFCHY